MIGQPMPVTTPTCAEVKPVTRLATRMLATIALSLPVLLSAAPAGATVPGTDLPGAPCADVIDGGANYVGNHLAVQVELASARCAPTAYVLYVIEGGVTTTHRSVADFPDAAHPVWDVTTNGSTHVGIFVRTVRGHRVFDRAPDSGAIDVANDGGGSGGLLMR
jgi:hypothetical protein